jgi:hypothetical protein
MIGRRAPALNNRLCLIEQEMAEKWTHVRFGKQRPAPMMGPVERTTHFAPPPVLPHRWGERSR